MIGFRDVHKAASGLHEVLSSLWRCDRRGLYYACICVDIKDEEPFHHPQNIWFDLAWTCPSKRKLPDHVEKPLRLSVEAIADPKAGIAGPPQFLKHQEKLQTSLKAATSSSTKRKPPLHPDPHLNSGTVVFASLPNLSSMPNLCGHLRQHPCHTANPHGVGFFETSATSRHFVYSQCDSRPQTKSPKTLEDALKASKSLADGIPLPEKLNIAKLLALAVLQYHSTPWMVANWRSRDVVFLNVQDFAQDPLQTPYLKSKVSMGKGVAKQQVSMIQRPQSPANPQEIWNQTIYSLGVMLLELAYDAPLADLRTPADGRQDANLMHRAAARLKDSVWRKLGTKYADVVKICMHCALEPSNDLDSGDLQERFFDEVVQKLSFISKAMME